MGDNDNIKIVIQKWFNNSADWQKDLFVNLWKGKDYESSKNRALRLLLIWFWIKKATPKLS